MRENLSLRFSLFLVIFLVLFLAAPATAYDYNGSFTNGITGGVISREFDTSTGAAGVDDDLGRIYFTAAENHQMLGAVKQYATLDQVQPVGYNAATWENSSYYSCSLQREDVTLSTGIFGYQIDLFNNIQVYYIAYYPKDFNMAKFNGTYWAKIVPLTTAPWTLKIYEGAALSTDPYFASFGANNGDAGGHRAIYSTKPIGAQTDDVAEWKNWYFYYTNTTTGVKKRTLDLYRSGDPSGKFDPSYDVGTYRFYSKVKVNQTIGKINVTLANLGGNGDIQVDNVPLGYLTYIEVLDNQGLPYSLVIPPELSLGITVATGQTCTNTLPVDTTTPATITGTVGGEGISYLVWEWSENWDDYTTTTSSLKKRNDYRIAYQYNWTNTTAATDGGWERISYGFNTKSTLSPTTQWGAYTWDEIKSQAVRFNWSATEPSWSHESELGHPYNYVRISAYDSGYNLLGAGSQSVCVSKGPDTGQFDIFVMDSTMTSKVYDANIFVFDTDASPGAWIVNNVNATYGRYVVDVNVSHAHYIWVSKIGYVFLKGHDVTAGSYQDLTAGCVTYSIPFPGTKQITLVMEKTGPGNTTVVFQTWAQPDDLITPPVRVSNAKITLTGYTTAGGIQSSDVIYTDSQGRALFQAIQNINYEYVAEDSSISDCYRKVTGQFSSNAPQTISVTFDACSLQPTLTSTVTPTPTPTIAPGPGEEGADIISSFIRLFQLAGAGTTANAKLMLALVICAVLAFIFGYYLSFQASLIGAFIGFVFSLAFGLIPLWIMIALIFVGGVFFVGKWWSGAGGG